MTTRREWWWLRVVARDRYDHSMGGNSLGFVEMTWEGVLSHII